jgi:hypothetical protein
MAQSLKQKPPVRATYISLVGWYGVIAILVAYALVTFKLVDGDNLLYQLLNLTGAIGIGTVAATKRDAQPVVVNAVWALVALIAIVRIIVS